MPAPSYPPPSPSPTRGEGIRGACKGEGTEASHRTPLRRPAACRSPPSGYASGVRGGPPRAEGAPVPYVSILFGILLIALSVDGYFDIWDFVRPHSLASPTTLIPGGFGVVLVLCGLVALKQSLLKHAMHLAAAVGLIGLLVSAARSLPRLPAYLAGEAEHPAAVRMQLAMAAICLVF